MLNDIIKTIMCVIHADIIYHLKPVLNVKNFKHTIYL